jgi:hypothetical protein
MGCCANKKCDRPKEEMLSSDALLSLLDDSSWVVTKLLEMAKSGIRYVGFKNEKISELAAAISAIVAENNYLKSLLGVVSPDNVKTTKDGATLFFGPRGEYSLFIATPTQEARNKLAAGLIAAGKELQQNKQITPDPRQQFLPFEN